MTNNDMTAAYVGVSAVTKICLGEDVVWPTTPPVPVYSAMPLTFEIISGGTIAWKTTNETLNRPIEYSLNGGGWTTIPGNTAGTVINVAAGDKISFRGDNDGYGTPEVGGMRRTRFTSSTCIFKIYGNILSLCYLDDFEQYTRGKNNGGFNFIGMFEATRVTDASNLILPKNLFGSDLRYFFYNCTLLETGPTIEADATTSRCMGEMFYGCARLNYLKCLATNISGSNSTTNWVSGVAASGTFVKAPGMTGWTTGVNGIPANWTVEDADI